MLEYSQTPNAHNAIKSAIAAVLPVTIEGWQPIAAAFADVINLVWKSIPYGNAKMCKEIRSGLLADITRFTKGEDLQTPAMQKLVESFTDKVSYEQRLQLMFSLADSPKFLMFSEKDLRRMADRIEEHQDEINAVTYFKDGKRICPYSPSDYHDDTDLIGTIMLQSGNIKQFLLENANSQGEKDFYSEHFEEQRNIAVQYLRKLPELIDNYSIGLYNPTPLEKQWFDSVLYIRGHMDLTAMRMHTYANGNATSTMFSLSESKAPVSDNEAVMNVLHKLGFNKSSCPAVLSNIFYSPELKLIGIEKQKGQIEIHYEIYFAPAPGLGPGFKVRWVYSIDTNINNFLTPLADLIQEADRENDPNQAYNDQLTYLLANLPDITDAYCTDSTGYSDYLWRGIYRYLMELFHVPYDIIDKVMKCFALPVKIGKRYIRVEFGTFQGCKLLVFIMNHANRLMGIIADKLQGQNHLCIRPNAGDDVTKACLDGKFTIEDIMKEILVFALFNSPTNISKSAWLDRDGYFDFCSKYFAWIDGSIHCVSGVPAKKYGKEIVCVADWAETFKVLHTSGQQHSECAAAFNLALPFIRSGLEEGCRLPNIYHLQMTLDSKIEQAKTVPFTYGGIADHDEERDLGILIDTLKYKASLLLNTYLYKPMGVFIVVNKIEDLQGTELLKAIGSINKQPVADLVKLIRMLADPCAMSYEDFEWAKEAIAKFERNSINGQSLSRTSSTYHRIERNKDVDLLFPIGTISAEIGMPLPEDNASALLMVSILADEKFVDIDNMRRYITAMKAVQAHPGCIVAYSGIANRTYYAVKDPNTRKLIRIYYNDDRRYDSFESIHDCQDRQLVELVEILRACHASDYVNMFYNIGEKVSADEVSKMATRMLAQQVTHMARSTLEGLLKKSLENIIK